MIRVFVDRVEGKRAVLELPGGGTLEVDAADLPAGTEEGEWLRLAFERDPAETEGRRRDVAARQARLSADDDGSDIVL